MKKSLTTKELLETYYKGLTQKKELESVIADDFKFTGGDMTNTTPVVGRQKYIEILGRFSQLVTDRRVKEMIIEKDSACVIANYDYVFPNGKNSNGNVAEIWKVKNDKLIRLLYFLIP